MLPKRENSKSRKRKLIRNITIIGSIASIIALGLWFLPKEKDYSLQLTIMVEDESGNVIVENQGELVVDFGNDRRRAKIGEDGRTNFGEIPSIFMDSTITIGFNVEGYEIVDGNNQFIFENKPIHLVVRKDNSLGTIKGIVKSRDGQEFLADVQIRINADTIILTDSSGFFRVVLPERMRVENLTDGYKLEVSKTGYITQTQYYYPKSSDAEIRLEKD